MSKSTHERQNCNSGLELDFRVARWFLSLRTVPTFKDIMDRWGVHRATAYRWLQAWRDSGE